MKTVCVNWELPCGRVASVDRDFIAFLPFFGCLDYCPVGLDLHDCEVFLKAWREDMGLQDEE